MNFCSDHEDGSPIALYGLLMVPEDMPDSCLQFIDTLMKLLHKTDFSFPRIPCGQFLCCAFILWIPQDCFFLISVLSMRQSESGSLPKLDERLNRRCWILRGCESNVQSVPQKPKLKAIPENTSPPCTGKFWRQLTWSLTRNRDHPCKYNPNSTDRKSYQTSTQNWSLGFPNTFPSPLFHNPTLTDEISWHGFIIVQGHGSEHVMGRLQSHLIATPAIQLQFNVVCHVKN